MLQSLTDVGVKPSIPLSTGTLLDNMCRRLVLKMLSNIKIGCIRFEEKGNNPQVFGNVDSQEVVSVKVFNSKVYRAIVLRGTIGAGEGYMHGWWSVSDTTAMIQIMLKNREYARNMNSVWSFLGKGILSLKDRFNINSIKGAKKNISYHYNLSNDFFGLMLDKHMQYSSAVFLDKSNSLQQASANKLDTIIDSLNITRNDHLLEIGTGWGGLAVYIAKKTGCKITSTTISSEQYRFAKNWVAREGLEEQVTLLERDYRSLTGSYDKIVSVEMIEAIGYKNYRNFFTQCNALLKDKGRALIQAITTTDARFKREKNQTDFIRTYIFPGGCLPSNKAMLDALVGTPFNLIAMRDMTEDYAETLKVWKQRFFQQQLQVKKMGFSDDFVRLWDFYLSYCEGGFRERVIHTSQFLFEKS